MLRLTAIIFVLFHLVLHSAGATDGNAAIDRPAKEIVLQLKDKKESVHVDAAPYISGGIITLYPGDKINVEFEIIDSLPKNPKVVKDMAHPERTLQLEMKQDASMTSLSRSSGFARKLTMDSYFLLVGSDFKNHANMYPLDKGLPCFDAFESNAYCIKLYDFGFDP